MKRTKESQVKRSNKVRKINAKIKNDDEIDEVKVLSVDEIKRAQDKILKANYNDITELLKQLDLVRKRLIDEKNQDLETIARQLCISLYEIFVNLMKDGLLINKKNYDDKKRILVQWLIKKYQLFKDILNLLVSTKLSYKTSLQLDAVEIVLKAIKLESIYNSNEKYFPTITYKHFITSLLLSTNGELTTEGSDDFVILEFLESFSQNYDLQFYFFQDLWETINEWRSQTPQQINRIFSNLLTILNNELLLVKHPDVKTLTTLTKTPPSLIFKTSTFKVNYQKTITSLLRYKLSLNQYKSILAIMNKRILPLMAEPTSLMDFLTECYDSQDLIVQILSLGSLYDLMKTYNLEYPDFYRKLYSLLKPDILLSRYRSRFIRLCDLFLTSTHISANLVASFIKKFARLSIYSSAAGTIIVIPLIYNLLKRHPSCMIMIHNPHKYQEYSDPYKGDETDPLKTEAINSSLWELEALMNHYHPNISTLANIFKEPFRKPNYNMEDFLDWTYQLLLENEINKKYKSMAALEYESFPELFGSGYLKGWSL